MSGGGYYDETVGPGLVYVVARTTVGPIENLGTARSMWEQRATKLCNGEFRELEIVEYVDEPLAPALPGIRYLISTRRGYALCATSPLSPEEAKLRLDEGARIATEPPASTR